MSRSFDLATGPNYAITSVGSCGAIGNGAYTIIVLFNIAAGNNSAGLISFRTSGINAQLMIDTNQFFGANDFGGGQTGITTATWWWGAIRKAAGTAVYRYSLRQYNTGSTTHQNSAATHADSGVTNTSIRLADSDDRGNGLVAVWAAWASNLSDSAVAGMFTTAAADVSAQSPAALWLGNQASSSDPIPDSTGNGAGSSSFNGTVGIGADPPSYNYSLSGSTGLWLPVQPARRRTPPPRRRPASASPPRAQLNPPIPIGQPRRPRIVPARRGRRAMPVPAQVVVAPPVFVPRAVRLRVRGLRLFRGRAAGPIPSQVVVVPPAYPPSLVRARLKFGRFFRGRAASPVPVQVVVPPPSFVSSAVRARLKWLRWGRARTAAPLSVQAAPLAAARPRPRMVVPRRGHASMPAPLQAAATPAPYPPRPSRPRLSALRQARGHQAAMPVPPQVVIPAPPYVPALTRLKKRLFGIFRPSSVTPISASAATPTAPSSPSPELFTASTGRDLGTSSDGQDLITETYNPDLEA